MNWIELYFKIHIAGDIIGTIIAIVLLILVYLEWRDWIGGVNK